MSSIRFLLLGLCVAGLTGCACPNTEKFHGTPYDRGDHTSERTAGSGMIDEGCFRRSVEIHR